MATSSSGTAPFRFNFTFNHKGFSMQDNLFPTSFVMGWILGLPVIAYLLLRTLGIHYPSEPIDFFGFLLLNSITGICLGAAIGSLRKRHLMNSLPTSKTQGVFMGQVELKGTAHASEAGTFEGRFSGKPCLCCRWMIEEQYRNDKDETKWRTVKTQTDHVPFFLRDETGEILVRPESAELEFPGQPFIEYQGNRRHTEYRLLPGTPLYLLGPAKFNEETGKPEICADGHSPIFTITPSDEESTARSELLAAMIGLIFAWLCTSGLGILIVGAALEGRSFGAEPFFRIFGVTGTVFGSLGVLTYFYEKYASLVALRNYALQGKSNLDVEFRRRSTLIPQLTAIVQGLREHTEALELILAALRSGMAGKLRQAAETYPELGTNENFRRLEEELERTETKISLAKNYFNDIATNLNTRLETIPDCWIGMLAGIRKLPLIQEETSDETAA